MWFIYKEVRCLNEGVMFINKVVRCVSERVMCHNEGVMRVNDSIGIKLAHKLVYSLIPDTVF